MRPKISKICHECDKQFSCRQSFWRHKQNFHKHDKSSSESISQIQLTNQDQASSEPISQIQLPNQDQASSETNSQSQNQTTIENTVQIPAPKTTQNNKSVANQLVKVVDQLVKVVDQLVKVAEQLVNVEDQKTVQVADQTVKVDISMPMQSRIAINNEKINMAQTVKEHICSNCHNKFSCRQNLRRHIRDKTCTKLNNSD